MPVVMYETGWPKERWGVAEPEEPYGKKQKALTDEEELYGTGEELYAEILEYLGQEYLKEKYSLCLQIRDETGGVVYEFPKVVCPELFLKQLKVKKS